jgi:hypothetical protein
MAHHTVERRTNPRAGIDFRAVLETAAGDKINLRARNISASGIYFDVDSRLNEFTEVNLVVSLPAVGRLQALVFRCEGIIVRVEENPGGGSWPYAAAVHFTGIDALHQQAVSAYVEETIARA